MNIKDENINNLMKYFDDYSKAGYEALDQYAKMCKQGIITSDTWHQAEVDILRLIIEHNKIRNILFGE